MEQPENTEAPVNETVIPRNRRRVLNDSDTDFRAESDDGDNDDDDDVGQFKREELGLRDVAQPSPKQAPQASPSYIVPSQPIAISTPSKPKAKALKTKAGRYSRQPC
jgi:hypothetical protein